MSDNTNTQAEVPTPTIKEEVNYTKQIQELSKQLQELDATEGKKVQEMLSKAAAAHAQPGGENVKVEGKTEAEWYEAFKVESEKVGETRAKLEEQMTKAMQAAGRSETPEERRKLWEERVAAANKAAQEPLKDLSKFSNEQLDKVRSQLQSGPPPGGERSAVDDGTGGETPEAKAATAATAGKPK